MMLLGTAKPSLVRSHQQLTADVVIRNQVVHCWL